MCCRSGASPSTKQSDGNHHQRQLPSGPALHNGQPGPLSRSGGLGVSTPLQRHIYAHCWHSATLNTFARDSSGCFFLFTVYKRKCLYLLAGRSVEARVGVGRGTRGENKEEGGRPCKRSEQDSRRKKRERDSGPSVSLARGQTAAHRALAHA